MEKSFSTNILYAEIRVLHKIVLLLLNCTDGSYISSIVKICITMRMYILAVL